MVSISLLKNIQPEHIIIFFSKSAVVAGIVPISYCYFPTVRWQLCLPITFFRGRSFLLIEKLVYKGRGHVFFTEISTLAHLARTHTNEKAGSLEINAMASPLLLLVCNSCIATCKQFKICKERSCKLYFIFFSFLYGVTPWRGGRNP